MQEDVSPFFGKLVVATWMAVEKARIHSDTGKIGCGHVGEDSIIGDPGPAYCLGGGALPGRKGFVAS